MPKVKWIGQPKATPPNMARDLINRYMKERRMTSAQLGAVVGMEPESVRRKKCRGVWTTDEFAAWCRALGIEDAEEIGKAVMNRV